MLVAVAVTKPELLDLEPAVEVPVEEALEEVEVLTTGKNDVSSL